jgi:hypothetical protein
MMTEEGRVEIGVCGGASKRADAELGRRFSGALAIKGVGRERGALARAPSTRDADADAAREQSNESRLR